MMMPYFSPYLLSVVPLSGHCTPAHGQSVAARGGRLWRIIAVFYDPCTPPNYRQPRRGLRFGLYQSLPDYAHNMLKLPDKVCFNRGVVCVGLQSADRSIRLCATVCVVWSATGNFLYAYARACVHVCVCVCIFHIGFFTYFTDQRKTIEFFVVLQMVIVSFSCGPIRGQRGPRRGYYHG